MGDPQREAFEWLHSVAGSGTMTPHTIATVCKRIAAQAAEIERLKDRIVGLEQRPFTLTLQNANAEIERLKAALKTYDQRHTEDEETIKELEAHLGEAMSQRSALRAAASPFVDWFNDRSLIYDSRGGTTTSLADSTVTEAPPFTMGNFRRLRAAATKARGDSS